MSTRGNQVTECAQCGLTYEPSELYPRDGKCDDCFFSTASYTEKFLSDPGNRRIYEEECAKAERRAKKR